MFRRLVQMFRRFVWKMLAIDQLERRVDIIDFRLHVTELQCDAMLRRFGGYKYRTQRELKLMGAQIQDLIEACEALLERSDSEEAIKRAKALRRRLRNHLTRASNAQTKGGMNVTLKSTG